LLLKFGKEILSAKAQNHLFSTESVIVDDPLPI